MLHSIIPYFLPSCFSPFQALLRNKKRQKWKEEEKKG
jgi:hypothetical protein